MITPVKWSADNGTLYFAPEASLADVPVGIRLYTAAARLDTENGTWEKVLEETGRYYDFAVSSDDAYLAYTQPVGSFGDNTSVTLSVLNLKNEHEAKYSLEGVVAGNIVWSPYTSRFVFQVQNPEGGTSILYYDVEKDVLKYILKEEKDDFLISSWGENNLVSLKRNARPGRTLSDWILNPFTNELMPVPTAN